MFSGLRCLSVYERRIDETRDCKHLSAFYELDMRLDVRLPLLMHNYDDDHDEHDDDDNISPFG